MGFLNDFKKLFFGAKSVAKSSGEKVVTAGKEKGEELADKAGNFMDKAEEKLEDVGAKVRETTEDIVHKAKDKVEDITDSLFNKDDEDPIDVSIADTSIEEDLASISEEPVEEIVEEAAASTGGEILEKGNKVMDKMNIHQIICLSGISTSSECE